ncbi:hypothetical protein Y032_0012g1841 [Ancylostoma ceylanicum]|uniref:Uncharacterized protein n=1 Tax=Ancylostoma ceylanicum TaxID=53326 RepID=A0A016VCH0_9BILA|nr:hypothetical protein Y032_0012g1841 [Ancylostoma ceylanicum]
MIVLLERRCGGDSALEFYIRKYFSNFRIFEHSNKYSNSIRFRQNSILHPRRARGATASLEQESSQDQQTYRLDLRYTFTVSSSWTIRADLEKEDSSTT